MDMHPENTDESHKYGRIPEVWMNPRSMDESQNYGRTWKVRMNLGKWEILKIQMVLKKQMP